MASTKQFYILTVSVGRKSGYRLAGSHRLHSMPAGAVVLIWSSGPSLKLMEQLVGRIHFLDVVGLRPWLLEATPLHGQLISYFSFLPWDGKRILLLLLRLSPD